MKKQQIIMMRGVPGSGKSTFAKEYIQKNTLFKRINRDSLRAMFDNNTKSDKSEAFIKKMRDVLVQEALKEGYSVIIDDLNLSIKHQRRMQDLANIIRKKHQIEVKVSVIEMETPLEVCIERDAARDKPVGKKVIQDLYEQFYGGATKPKKFELNYRAQQKDLPKAIICDLDGTLAIINHRNPYDASNCEKDKLNDPVADVLLTYKKRGHSIILLSGRLDTYKPQTLRWLQAHGIKYDLLLMRKEGDTRKDSIVKTEFFDTYIKDTFNITFALDDRNQVVDLWRKEIRIPCFQVNYGNF